MSNSRMLLTFLLLFSVAFVFQAMAQFQTLEASTKIISDANNVNVARFRQIVNAKATVNPLTFDPQQGDVNIHLDYSEAQPLPCFDIFIPGGCFVSDGQIPDLYHVQDPIGCGLQLRALAFSGQATCT